MLINIQNGKVTATAENDAEANNLISIAGIQAPKATLTTTADFLDEAVRTKRKYTKSGKPRKKRNVKNPKTKVHCSMCDAFVIKSIGLKTHMFLKHGLLSKKSSKFREGMTTYDTDNLAKPLFTNPLNC